MAGIRDSHLHLVLSQVKGHAIKRISILSDRDRIIRNPLFDSIDEVSCDLTVFRRLIGILSFLFIPYQQILKRITDRLKSDCCKVVYTLGISRSDNVAICIPYIKVEMIYRCRHFNIVARVVRSRHYRYRIPKQLDNRCRSRCGSRYPGSKLLRALQCDFTHSIIIVHYTQFIQHAVGFIDHERLALIIPITAHILDGRSERAICLFSYSDDDQMALLCERILSP